MDNIFSGYYKNKKVLITGHTGFKGSWLLTWLLELGAKVTGYSAYLPSNPSNFEICGLEDKITHFKGDVRDFDLLSKVFTKTKPDIVFHLAAQPIVRTSFDKPKETFDTNLGGTVNILECIKKTDSVKSAVIITSDKCYHNVEWEWGYRENDKLGGHDPYSASKACAEIASHAYIHSFFNKPGTCKIATVRAGNVIGGGDWAEARIVPDCMKSWSKKEDVLIRSPHATRPWQHVLEPLSGYLIVGANLESQDNLHGEAFNFGPDSSVNQSVEVLISHLSNYWPGSSWKVLENNDHKKESGLLKLSCDKALHRLHWQAALEFEETVKFTSEWYLNYYENNSNMLNYTKEQINQYIYKAKSKKLDWAG